MKLISFREHPGIVCLKNYFMQEAFDRNWKINWSHFHFIQEFVATMRLLHQYGSFLASCSSRRSSSSGAPPVHSFCLPPVSNYEAAAPQVFWLCNLGGGCSFSRASECSRAVGKNGKTLGNSLGLQNNKKVIKRLQGFFSAASCWRWGWCLCYNNSNSFQSCCIGPGSGRLEWQCMSLTWQIQERTGIFLGLRLGD